MARKRVRSGGGTGDERISATADAHEAGASEQAEALLASAGGRPRLSDVARLAGVSLGSASRALSNPDSVREQTLRRVREAADRLGYVPDGAARALVMRRSMTIGAVLPTISNPIFSSFVHALQKALSAEGYYLLVAAHEYDLREEESVVERLVQRGIDGLVLIGTDHPPAVFRRIEQARMPYICAWSVDEAHRYPCVGISNRRAMHRVVRHLLELGHRRFAVVSGHTEHNERARARIEGILDALAMEDIQLDDDHILCGAFSIEAGREGLRRALALDPRPTAVICSTDLLAAGVLAEARAQGVDVPGSLSVTGFDDIEFSSLLSPALTSLHVRTDEIGRLTGERILDAIGKAPAREPLEIETRLVVRESTGPAPRS